MNFFNRFLKNQFGMSLPLVIVMTGVTLSSIGYVTLTLLPKLQDSKKKAERAVDYRIFLGSLNDYIVHGIKEKWCFSDKGTESDFTLTDFLLTNDCDSSKPMETIVRHRGNVERILWDLSSTIGNDANTRNTIMGLNAARKAQDASVPLLNPYDVQPPVDSDTGFPTLKFRITDQILNDMSDTHPLYAISKEIRSCLEDVDIEIARTNGGPNPSQGEEVKIRVSIDVNLQDLNLSCMAMKTISSVTYYTFYPRRLHTFALIKYNSLNTSDYHEYHSPVYVAGNLILPSTATNKAKSSIFYDTVTLGTYNGGNMDTTTPYGGVLYQNGQPYTFEDRGNPYKSKQDNYETVRGFLGGIRLDAVEDKGLVNLFDWDNTNQSTFETMERCIDESKILTTPSASSGTILAYRLNSNDTSTSTLRYKLGFTKLNRFKPVNTTPEALTAPASNHKFLITVPTPAPTSQSIGLLTFNYDADNIYRATMGAGEKVIIKIDLPKFNITPAEIDAMVVALNLPTTEANYANIIPNSHVFSELSERNNYIDKTEDLIDRCKQSNKDHPVYCLPVTIVGTCVPGTNPCDNTQNDYNDFISARNALVNKLNALKSEITSGEPEMTLSLENFNNSDSKLIINQKIFQAKFTGQWKTFYNIIKPNSLFPTMEFVGYNYGPEELKISTFITEDPNNLLKLKKDDGNDVNLASDWRNSFNNNNLNSSEEPVELVAINCPTGMGMADWDLDMSNSTNFAWNLTGATPGVDVDTSEHSNAPEIPFDTVTNNGHKKGPSDVLTGAVVDKCTIDKNRTHVYGFYVCKTLEIKSGRSAPLHMIGTFIVKNLNNYETNYPVHWHTIWEPIARDLILTDLNQNNANCASFATLKTKKDFITTPGLEDKYKQCSPMDLISNGPNNFTWTTTDPEIGLPPGETMTAEKVKRFHRWLVREDSRRDLIL